MKAGVGKRLATYLAIFAAVLLIAVGGMYAFVHTDQGRQFVARQIESLVNDPSGISVSLGDLKGNLLSDFELSSIELSDAEGTWATAEELRVDWSPLALLTGCLEMQDISLQSFTMNRQPTFASDTNEKDIPSSFSLPVSIELDRVRIETITIEEQVLGREAQLELSAKLNTLVNDSIHSEVKISRLDETEGSLDGVFSYHPEFRTLAIDVELKEPQGGLMARTLDLPGYPEITVSLSGDGALNAWRGQIRMNADKVFEGDLAISTRGETLIDIDVQGGGILAEDMTTSIPLIDGSYIGVEAAIAWDTVANNLLINSSRIENTNLSVTASGEIDLANETLKGDLVSRLRDPAALNTLIAPASMEKAVIDLAVDGTFSEITLDAIIQIGNAVYKDEIAANEATGTFSTKLNLNKKEEIPLSGSAAITGIFLLPSAVDAFIGTAVDIDFISSFDRVTEKIVVKEVKIVGGNVAAAGEGQYFVATGAGNAVADVKIHDLSKILPVTGSLSTTIDMEGLVPENRFGAKIEVQTTDLDLLDKALNDLVGALVSATAKVDFRNDVFDVSDFELQLPVGMVAGEAEIPSHFKSFSAKLMASVPELSRLGSLSNSNLKGAGTITADIEGNIDNPNIAGNIDVKNLEVEEFAVGNATARYGLKDIFTSPTGDIAGLVDPDNLNISFSSDINVRDFVRLKLDQISIIDNKNNISGAMTIPFDGTPLTGQLKALFPELATVSVLKNEEIFGNLEIEAAFGNLDGEQSLAFEVASLSLALPRHSIAVDAVSLNGTAVGNFSDPAIKSTMKISNLLFEKSNLDSAVVTIDGKLSDATYDVSLEMQTEPSLELAGGGSISKEKNISRFSLARLDGEFGDQKISLAEPLFLKQEGHLINIDNFVLAVGKGRLMGTLEITETSASSDLTITALPLDLLELFNPDLQVTGRLDGEAQFSIHEKGSNGTFSFAATQIQVEAAEYPDAPIFSSHLDGEIAEGKIEFEGDITGLEETAFDISGLIPVTATFTPFDIHINYDKPVNINLSVDSDIKALWPILSLDTQKSSGIFTANVDLQGTLSDPELQGSASLKNGGYEHTVLGMVLTNITLDIAVKDTENLTLDLTASDGHEGTISSTGKINISALDNPEMEISVLAKSLQALNLEDFQVKTDADITIEGPLTALNVGGRMTTREVEIDIGGQVAPTVVTLEVTEINRPGAEEVLISVQSGLDKDIRLAIDLEMPRRVYIRGRGLDSEWEGKLKISGTAETPIIEGFIKPVRGQFAFAGKSFVLQEGQITLSGDNLDPELHLSGKYTRADFTATVVIEGSTSDPEIKFHSDDGLPEDEVISQILFGKETGGLTALEAVQLAEAVASLSGNSGSGGGYSRFIQSALGLDTLSAGTNSETGDTEVSVGKYFNDNVYVGVDQGVEEDSTRAKVQIDLTPNLSLETEMGQATGSRVGVIWKWNY